MKKINLSACRWQVKGYYPYVPLKDRSMETGKELLGITDWLDAPVPGGVHAALYRAGLIEHPYRDLNSLKCEWVENRWWLYRTRIETSKLTGMRQSLVFAGIDDAAMIYVNGALRAEHCGMYDPVEIDVTDPVRNSESLEIRVLLRHAPDEMGQIGRTSETHTQKSRFNYKWDFSTRLVNLGIWEDCWIRCEEAAAWEDPSVSVELTREGRAVVHYTARVRRNADCSPEGVCTLARGETVLSAPCVRQGEQLRADIVVEQPELWFPNGYGAQPLYDLSVVLSQNGTELDRFETRVGLRSLTCRRNVGSPPDALPYTFVVNGVPVYVRGCNMTPLDHIYGDVSAGHYAQMVLLMKRMNVNLVRVWGGGIIEKEAFYKLCDENGILIWQEFIQSSSGLDNVPSKKPEFLSRLARTAEAAVRARRGHASLAVWSGGNELTDENGRPATYADRNIAMLREIVERLDPERLFLPTSASGPNEFVGGRKGCSHDIHGHWNYCGNPEHYRLYGESDSLFHSEFGTDGMCAPESLNRFLSPRYQTLVPAEENMVYRHHGEWWCTWNRDDALFGARRTVAQASACSQWIQAEGLRFILEANRRRKFQNSGSIIWQINEPWPNVYCTSLVDYYLTPKMAYYWCRTSFAPFAVSLDYRKLDYRPGEAFEGRIYVSLDGPSSGGACEVTAEALTGAGKPVARQTFSASVDTGRSACAGVCSFAMPEFSGGLVLVRLTAHGDWGSAENTYYFGCAAQGPVYAAALEAAAGTVTVQSVRQAGADCLEFQLANACDHPLLHVAPVCENYHLLAGDAYFTLLPGEVRQIRVRCYAKFASGFLPDVPSSEAPEIKWISFNERIREGDPS